MTTAKVRSELIQYAEQQLWSFPINNMQYQLEFKKISGPLGFIDSFRYFGRYRHVPMKKKYYHVFSLSGINTGYWNFQSWFNRQDPVPQWRNLADLTRVRGMNLNVYNPNGRMYPRDQCWVLNTLDGLNLLAIESTTQFPVNEGELTYIQCYTVQGRIYHGNMPDIYKDRKFRFYSATPTNQTELDDFNATFTAWSKEPGLTQIFKNGTYVSKQPVFADIPGNATYEISHDPSVVEVLDYPISGCPSFYSILDSKRKYILHPPKPELDDPEQWRYRYFSDTDIYVVNSKGRGVLLNRNQVANVRQLTHRDYSVAVDVVDSLVSMYDFLDSSDELVLRVVRRYNEATHYLGHEASYIRYLYTLDDQGIINAFTDTHSTLNEWTAAELEGCATNVLNRLPYGDITQGIVNDALGYNVAGTITSKTPNSDFNEHEEIDIPLTYRAQGMAVEYDVYGLLLGTQAFTNTSRYKPINEGCKLVEFVPGSPKSSFDWTIQDDPITLKPEWGYLVYKCGRLMPANEPNNDWVLAVPGEDYEVKDGVLTWLFNLNQYIGLVAFNDQFVYREFTLNHLDNSLTFSITHEWEGGGIGLPIAPANVTVIMNRRTLIENIDYVINYPDVYVLNKEFVKEGAQEFVVYYHGWSPKVDEPLNRSELGFVSRGVIGLNGRYNVRDNRVTKSVVYGRVYDTSKLPTAEAGVFDDDVLNPYNGYPYQVKHQYVAVKGMVDYDNYPGYLASMDMDVRVTNYLTEHGHLPSPVYQALQQERYSVFSPFMSKIVNDLILGLLVVKDPGEGKVFSTQYINDMTKNYQWMLEFDPAVNRWDERYFMVHPISSFGSLAVTPIQFLFIMAVNKFHLNDRCIINGYIEVKNA